MLKKIFLFASIVVASGLLFTNIYNSLVDARSWGGNMPHSIETARDYYKTANPGNFYRLFSPVNQVLGLLVIILFWKSSRSIRLYLAIAFLFYLLGDVLTFAYFYPRNDIIFKTPITEIETIKKAWSEWSTMNWIRSLIVFAGIIFSFLSLHKIYTLNVDKHT